MRALTLRQPWATAVARAGKTTENRSRPVSYRGPLAIHAGLAWDPGAEWDPALIRAWPLIAGPCDPDRPAPDAPAFADRGVIVAVAQLVGCHLSERACCFTWGSERRWHWELAHVRALSRPVAARGALGLWRPTPDVLAALKTI